MRNFNVLYTKIKQYINKLKYKYTSSATYISDLSFDYLETYSFQRGIDYEENFKVIIKEYHSLKAKKDKQNNLTELERLRFSELHSLVGVEQYLINDRGEFHPSSNRIACFQAGDDWVKRLITILRIEIKNVPMWMCGPIYRDAVVFYKDAQIVSVLNVCLSCEYMAIKPFEHINGDVEMYRMLRRYFKEIGHDVED